jgi:hypothetical protein
MDEVRESRQAFIKSAGGKCMWCGSRFGVAVHEILRGANRNKALSEPCTWLVLCSPCNTGQFHSRGTWPDAKQLALQYLCCPTVYDLKRFNLLYCERAPNRVTQDEVDAYISEITK